MGYGFNRVTTVNDIACPFLLSSLSGPIIISKETQILNTATHIHVPLFSQPGVRDPFNKCNAIPKFPLGSEESAFSGDFRVCILIDPRENVPTTRHNSGSVELKVETVTWPYGAPCDNEQATRGILCGLE